MKSQHDYLDAIEAWKKLATSYWLQLETARIKIKRLKRRIEELENK
jgi:hypothetical protein